MTKERLGEDLYPLLNPQSHKDLDQEQVARVIKKVTLGSLYTTRAARSRIARTSWNLYALRALLTRLRSHIRDNYRMYATVEDVIEVEGVINNELQRGEDPEAMSTYIRDALNAGVRAEQFRPVREFAVVAAYAQSLEYKYVGADAFESTLKTLAEWSSDMFKGMMSRPEYSRDLVERQLRALEEQQILETNKDSLGGYRFRSEFLRHYLVGNVSSWRHGSELFRDAMLRGGARTLRIPLERHAVGEGRQAKVWRFVQKGEEFAARVRELKSAQEQERFLDSAMVLERLSALRSTHRDGIECVYGLVDVGFLEGASASVAVEVYRYVPGVDLASKVAQLSARVVVEIGSKLTRALQLVHDADVLHRDIRPQNVVLVENTLLPVLIDFGLACGRSAPGGTPLDDEYTAPEVKGGGRRTTLVGRR